MSSQQSSSARAALLAVLALAASLALLAPAAAQAAGAIAGQVTAVGGDPIEGISACAYELGGDFEELCETTDADGEYVIAGLAAGQYKVEFWVETLEYVPEFYDDAEFWEDADPVTVVDAETTLGIDAELERSASIEGEVTAASGGAQLEEVVVCAWGEEVFRCDETGADGKYRLPRLWPGEYEVEFLDWFGGSAFQWWQDRERWYEADPVAVAAGEEKTGIDAALSLGGQIRGRVTSASTGAPLDGIFACAIDPVVDRLYICEETTANGQYALFNLSSAQYKVVFSPDFAEWFPGEESFDDGYPTQYWNGKGGLATADLINLTAPNVVAGIDARLGPPPSTPQPPPPPPTEVKKLKKPAGKPCRKGFKKKKIKGKKRCVKVRKGKKRGKGKAASAVKGRALSRMGAVRIQP